MDSLLFWLVPAASVLALCFAYYFHKQMMKESEGTPQMIKIAAAVRKGAMSYLKQQYKIVGWVFFGLVILFSIMAYGFQVQNAWVPIAFLTGGFFSGLSGFLGMKTATYASARTANAARKSLNAGLRIAFRSGAVMGLVVVGLGLLDISFWYLLLNWAIPADVLTPTHKLCIITTTMLTFGMGASTQALFARVGGGIYTKAADVGADLVGKVEAGIPEDDPRNPATIADNVGDNVGDVAGMGADLYESYCGSILATAALGAAAFMHTGDTVMQFKAVIAPMLIAAVQCFLVTLVRKRSASEIRVPRDCGSKPTSSRMMARIWLRPFFGGMNFSIRSEKKMQPTLSLFSEAEKASTAAISVCRFFFRRSVVPNIREPLTSTRSIIVSSRSSS